MTNILKNHGLDYKIVNGRTIAIEELYNVNGDLKQEETDVTDFTIEEIKFFLGY